VSSKLGLFRLRGGGLSSLEPIEFFEEDDELGVEGFEAPLDEDEDTALPVASSSMALFKVVTVHFEDDLVDEASSDIAEEGLAC